MNYDRRKEGWQYVLQNIADRRSVFPPAFIDEPIKNEEIELILEAANWAPTHKLTEPWRFVILVGKARHRLSDFLREHYLAQTPKDLVLEKKLRKLQSNPIRSGAVVAICLHRDHDERVPEWEELAAVACAVQNLWLAATALGIGGYWSTPSAIQDIGAFLELDTAEKCLGLFYLGYFDQRDVHPNRTPWNDKIRWMAD